jgi:hypothetical protein
MSKRSRWKPLSVLATVLVVSVASSWIIVGKAKDRKEFVGRVDPATGYRYRFLLSPAWKPQDLYSIWELPSEMEASFILMPSPIRQWLDARLLHKASPEPLSIQLIGSKMSDDGWGFHIVQGYPEYVVPVRMAVMPVTTTHEHLHIDGYPATRARWEWKQTGTTVLHNTFLFVYIPENSTGYTLSASCKDTAELAVIDQEMQAIIASFHIEKVASGDKR